MRQIAKSITVGAIAAVFLFMVPIFSAGAQPTDIRIVAPYAGFVTSVYERESANGDIRLKDTDLMLGLYAQWIRPGKFQANAFLYHAPDVNYASLWGLHTNVDFYFALGEIENLVIGGGVQFLMIDIDAGDNIVSVSPMGTEVNLQDFTLRTSVVAPYLRTGRQVPFGDARTNVVIFPWVGGEVNFVGGDVSFGLPFPPPGTTIDESIDDIDLYALAGINVRANLWRFLQIDAKYSAAFDPYTFLPRASIMTNVFFTRNLGVSYRFSAMESSAGSTVYHIFGVAGAF
ncbi:MAG: hypothetical protein EA403_02045 [Spirochaetaceae bacterium]|nr:MAG: hypothetical protein EA403_02045 [Spirochaetaceae bacterium]